MNHDSACSPVPFWAVDLLMAAKKVLAHERLSSSGDECLGMAVEQFEDHMPLTPDGEIRQTWPPNTCGFQVAGR
jgi:hypothetical protein